MLKLWNENSIDSFQKRNQLETFEDDRANSDGNKKNVMTEV